MKVEVLGVGNLFTPEITNTSFLLTPSYGKQKFLIDCGYNIFQKLVAGKYDIENIEEVIITHTHPDHVGSLGALIYYRWFMFNKTTEIVCGNRVGKHLLKILESTVFNVMQPGKIRLDEYEFCPYTLSFHDPLPSFIKMFEVQHGDIPAYGVYVKKEEIVFTGDSNLLNPLCDMFVNANMIFHDCIIDYHAKGIHSNLKDMEASYPKEIREKIQLVHHGKKTVVPSPLTNGMTLSYEGAIHTFK